MKKSEIEELFRRFERFGPEPKGELDFINPYTLLVAVVLSAQATDASVNKATQPLFKVADTPQKMLGLGEERLKEATAAAIARGVFGSPFVFVDGEPFWGADRLPQVDAWLARGGW